MPTTFNWFYLGPSGISLDPTEGNAVAENINLFVGNTYGSAGSPLFTKIASATMINNGGGTTALDGDNNVVNDQFSTNIGAGTQTFTFDISVQFNATITYANGTTATVTAVIVQSTTGELFLAPETSNNSDTTAYEAMPIRSITFNSVASYSGNFGIDRVVTGYSDGIVEGTSGNDLINAAYIEPAAFGKDRVDNNDAVLPGTSGNDDYIRAGAGNDTILAGAGNDTIDGGSGGDIIDGGAGTDTVTYVTSSAAVNVNLATGTGTGGDAQGDVLSNIENLTGSAFNDTLTGNAGANVLDGGAGNDILQGGAGADTLIGGAGTDTASYSNSAAGVNVNLATGTGTGGDAQGDVLNGIENLTGSAFNDTLTGNAGANVLDGGAGNDILQGGAGGDTLIGGAGTDTASYSNSAAGVTVNLATGTGTGGDAQGDVLSGIENLTGSAFNDTLTGNAGANVLDGGAGNDILQGGAGADTLTGGAGNDTFIYNSGDGADLITDFNTGNTGPINDGNQTNNDFINLSGFYNSGSLAAYNAANGALPDFRYAIYLMRADIADGKLDGIINGINIGLGIDLTLSGVSGANLTFDNTSVVCFVKGTRILTQDGEVPIEDLRPGDKVVTADDSRQPIRWIGSRKVNASGSLAPIRFAAGSCGNIRDLMVSPQHRMMISGWEVELYFGELEVLAAAKHFVDGDRVSIVPGGEVEYFHMIFDRHEIVFAEGAPSESFHPGYVGMTALDLDARKEVLSLFPELVTAGPGAYGPAARRSLKAAEARFLASVLSCRSRPQVFGLTNVNPFQYPERSNLSDRAEIAPVGESICKIALDVLSVDDVAQHGFGCWPQNQPDVGSPRLTN